MLKGGVSLPLSTSSCKESWCKLVKIIWTVVCDVACGKWTRFFEWEKNGSLGSEGIRFHLEEKETVLERLLTVPDTHKFPLDARIRIASHARIRIASHRMRGNTRMCEHSHRTREMRAYARIRIPCAHVRAFASHARKCAHMRAFASHARKCAHYDAKDA